PKERNMFTSVMGTGWGVDCDEIYPRIFLGDEASARNLGFLKKIKVTHVLNAAEGPWTDHSFVDLNKAYYEGTGIVYQGFELWDHPGVNIERYFGPANEFIASCIDGGGRILIHCQMGVSRSCVCAMSYLMLTKDFLLWKPLKYSAPVVTQVAHLDNELRKEREYRIPSRVKIFLSETCHISQSLFTMKSLPFTMKWKNSDGKNLNKENAPEANLLKPLITTKTPSKEPSTASSSEWEYYTETEEDE
ncbi:Testis/ seletal muscle dual specificty phosphatase, partial [Caligus rogercresseyi]